jgi:hypothetical protein
MFLPSEKLYQPSEREPDIGRETEKEIIVSVGKDVICCVCNKFAEEAQDSRE